ncbi:MAG: DUF4271 domain-containing protein [Chitinophagaceae bacterium]
MKLKQFLFLFNLLLFVSGSAQRDSAFLRDTFLVKNTDTAKTEQGLLPQRFDSIVYTNHPFFHFANPIRQVVTKRQWIGKEAFFYAAIVLLIFFALIRNIFNKYLQDLFRLFFRTTLRQRQIKEQMLEVPLPSLLLNILFILTGALYLNLVLKHYHLGDQYNFWLLLVYSIIGLTIIYVVKFITLKLFGWLLKLTEATDGYIFIIFSTNKIIGIALLPFIILLSFTAGLINEIALTLSLIIVGLLFVYRFYLSYVSIRKLVRLEFFIFFFTYWHLK